MDFIETVTFAGTRQYILVAIHHTRRRIRVLGTTAHPTHAWVTQPVRNLLMDLEDVGSLARDLPQAREIARIRGARRAPAGSSRRDHS